MPDLKDIGSEVLSILKDSTKDLWDGPEDTDFLKTVGVEIFKLRAQKIAGIQGLEVEIEVLEEAVKQKTMQKAIRVNGLGEKVLHKIVGIVGRMALTLI